VFGAIFASRLAAQLQRALPPGAAPAEHGISPQMLAGLSPALREIYIHAFTASLATVFVTATVIALVGFALSLAVPERPLRETIAAAAGDPGSELEEVFPMPSDASSLMRLERSLSVLASRDVRREYIERVVARAGLTLGTAAAWLLVRIEETRAWTCAR
jgi:hypothetical protein